MNFLKDADFKHYFKMFMIGIVVFGILSFLFLYIFKDDYGIVLNKDTVEYGKNVRIVDLVESVAGNPINDSNKISSNTISVNGYEVTFDEIDTFKLGNQNITAKYTDSSIKEQSLSVNIVDTKKPIIKIKKDIGTKMDLKDVRKLKVFYSVSDNETPDTKIKIKKYIIEEKYTYGDTVHLVIEATDKSGNVSKKKIKININEKKVEKEDVKVENDEDKDKHDASSEQHIQESSTQSNQSVQQSVQQAPQQSQITPAPSQPSRPKPSNKQYLFSQGYDMSSAPSACQNDLLSSGYSGSCTPIQDSDGIYLGMQLIFN